MNATVQYKCNRQKTDILKYPKRKGDNSTAVKQWKRLPGGRNKEKMHSMYRWLTPFPAMVTIRSGRAQDHWMPLPFQDSDSEPRR